MINNIDLPSVELLKKALSLEEGHNSFSRYNQINLCRLAIDQMLREILVDKLSLTGSVETSLAKRVSALKKVEDLPEYVQGNLNNIMTWRNVASHNADAIKPHDISLIKTQIKSIFYWYLVEYLQGPKLTKDEFEAVLSKNVNLRIFISYASEDRNRVDEIYNRLKRRGFIPWMDKKSLLPGQNWEDEITKEIKRSDFFIACLSKNSISKRGFIQKEIKYALDVLGEIPPGRIFFVPVRLEPCDVPDYLNFLHWIDLDNNDSYEKLYKALATGH